MTDTTSRPAPAAAVQPRVLPVHVILIHNEPTPAAEALARYTDPAATFAPHFHVAANGTATQLVDPTLAARFSGPSEWQGQPMEADQISVHIALERTPGAPFPAALAQSLRTRFDALRAQFALPEDAARRWDPAEQGNPHGTGFLLPFTVPVVPPETPPTALLDLGGQGLDDGDTTCSPPPLPPLTDGAVLDGGEIRDVPAPADLWRFLHQETYRQRGEGFHPEWALHRRAVHDKLGTPLAPSTGITVNGRDYLMQTFARGVLYNEKPHWDALVRIDTSTGVPSDGIALGLFSAAFDQTRNPLKAGWASHQAAARANLGPALGAAYRITVDGQEYSLQVFAGDTLYCQVPQWNDIRRLSVTTEPALRAALTAESYKPSGATYDPFSPLQQAADQANDLGTPLTAPYQALLNSANVTIQVFANDTLYVLFDQPVARLSQLAPPANDGPPPPAADAVIANTQVAGSIADAFSRQRPLFTMLPLPGQPPISQFYGYTRFSASPTGRSLYGMTQSRHSGLDFAVPVGTPLLSIGYGVVVHSGESGPFGAKLPQSIVVRYGGIYALYGHASVCAVAKGQFVTPGQEIGRSGSYNGPHLHFELRAVPDQALGNTDPRQNAVNPGRTFNPVDCFSPTLDDYFARMLQRLGTGDGGFCCGNFRDQGEIVFGGPVDTRPCQ